MLPTSRNSHCIVILLVPSYMHLLDQQVGDQFIIYSCAPHACVYTVQVFASNLKILIQENIKH